MADAFEVFRVFVKHEVFHDMSHLIQSGASPISTFGKVSASILLRFRDGASRKPNKPKPAGEFLVDEHFNHSIVQPTMVANLLVPKR